MAWLIDTKKQCLVPAKAELQYVTLGYVLGQAAMLRTERANLLAHQKDRVFDRLRVMMPATINDAIGLVPYGRHLESSVAQMPQPIGRYLCASTQQGRLWGDKERILMPEELGSTKETFDLYQMFLELPLVLRNSEE